MKQGHINLKPIPYVSFVTFLSALDELEGTQPRLLDRESCGVTSKASWSQLSLALRILKLMDEQGAPLKLLKSLVEPKTRRRTLGKILEAHFPEIFAADLSRIKRPQLDQILTGYGVKAGTLQKARSFFLGAAHYSDMKLSPELESAIRLRVSRRHNAPNIQTRTANSARFGLIEPSLSKTDTLSLTAHDMTLSLTFRRGSLPEIKKRQHHLLPHLFDEILSFIQREDRAKSRPFTSL